jgi:hypothetical protein
MPSLVGSLQYQKERSSVVLPLTEIEFCLDMRSSTIERVAHPLFLASSVRKWLQLNITFRKELDVSNWNDSSALEITSPKIHCCGAPVISSNALISCR